MADDEQLSSDHSFGDAGRDEKKYWQSPPQKKHKVVEERHGIEVEEEDEEEEEAEAVADDDEAENDSNGCFTYPEDRWEELKHIYCPDGVEEVDEDVWHKYLQEIKESEGFDIYHFPGPCWAAQYFPLNVDEKNSSDLKIQIECSHSAIADFNQKEQTKYKFEKVEKANAQLWDIGVNFYITFQAKDSVADAFNTFQALVYRAPHDSPPIVVKFCRLKLSAAT